MSARNSIAARDFDLVFPLLMAAGVAVGFFMFLFFVFGGAVDLKDATVSALVGATISSIVNVPLAVVLSHVFSRGRAIDKNRDQDAPSESSPCP